MRYGRTDAERQTWHSWFAWRPVRMSTGRWVWLERVERCSYFASHIDPRTHFSVFGCWVYR